MSEIGATAPTGKDIGHEHRAERLAPERHLMPLATDAMG